MRSDVLDAALDAGTVGVVDEPRSPVDASAAEATRGAGGGDGSQMRKGVLALVLLQVCAEQERYAHEIRAVLGRAGMRVSSGALYPALKRLERGGLLRSRLVETARGPARRYYATTRLGRRELRTLLRLWSELAEAVDRLVDRDLPPRPAPGA